MASSGAKLANVRAGGRRIEIAAEMKLRAQQEQHQADDQEPMSGGRPEHTDNSIDQD